MCGIAGMLGVGAADPRTLDRMLATLAHRGPDGDGVWTDPNVEVGLAHTRLAVVGLGESGAQPMSSASGRFVITYNGELYEHLELRRALEATGRAPSWQGTSDTETLLACLEAWGLQETLTRTVGMFAFGLWDRDRAELTLVRDRLGEKPLHYAQFGATFLFASEIGALEAHPAHARRVDAASVAQLLRYGQIPGPATIHPDIRKLAPGTMLTVRAADRPAAPALGLAPAPAPVAAPEPYWSLPALADPAAGQRQPLTDAQTLARFDGILRRAVASQTLSEVPLGAFLSGGVDSSAIVALLTRTSSGVRTFTIGFEDTAFDEAPYARAIARHLGTDHTEFRVSESDVLALIPDLADVYAEPFADASQLPTLLLSRLARRSVTVCLTGDGGDELFGGYARYARARRIEQLPRPIRSLGAQLLRRTPVRLVDRLIGGRPGRDPGRASAAISGHRLRALGSILAGRDAYTRYRDLVAVGLEPTALLRLSTAATQELAAREAARMAIWDRLGPLGPRERMMAFDTLTYLPDDILPKVDRAAMSIALETRIPLLDHRVVEFAWSLPAAMRVRDGHSKWLLRRLAEQYIPAPLLDRPKAGFAVPLATWLRGPLRPWASTLLAEAERVSDGLLDGAILAARWAEHQSGRRERHNELWPVLMLVAWLQARRGPDRRIPSGI